MSSGDPLRFGWKKSKNIASSFKLTQTKSQILTPRSPSLSYAHKCCSHFDEFQKLVTFYWYKNWHTTSCFLQKAGRKSRSTLYLELVMHYWKPCFVSVRAEMVTVFYTRCATHLAAWAAYSSGSWYGSRNYVIGLMTDNIYVYITDIQILVIW